MVNQITRELVERIADQGGFLPREAGYRDGADLDGLSAHLFLQSLGFVCWGHHDTGRNGIAYTACGILLSTNGYCHRDFAKADAYRGGVR